MKNVFKSGSSEKQDVEALAERWAIRCAEASLDAGQQRELDEWLASDARHLGAFVRAQAIWLNIDRVASLQGAAPVQPAGQPRRGRRWFQVAAAASVAVVLASGILAYDRLAGRVATGRGEVQWVTLDDGSSVWLNGSSALQVRFQPHRRQIVLRQGEASFQVAHDPERPFVVTAGDVTVTAVGTEFLVGMEDEEVAVTVAEGVVQVQRDSASGERQQYLQQNEQFVAATTGPRRARLDPGEVNRRLAWRDGLLVFEGQPLGEAARVVNKHSTHPVVIDDPTLARAEFIGVFHIGDSRSFANAAAYAFNGEVIERDGAYHLVRQQNSPSH